MPCNAKYCRLVRPVRSWSRVHELRDHRLCVVEDDNWALVVLVFEQIFNEGEGRSESCHLSVEFCHRLAVVAQRRPHNPRATLSPFILTSTMLLAPCIRHAPHQLLSPRSRGSIRLYSSLPSDSNKPYYLTTPIFYPNSGTGQAASDATSL